MNREKRRSLPLFWKLLSAVDSMYVLASRILWSVVLMGIILAFGRKGKAVREAGRKELLPLTGYVHGGCSPVGMKKQFHTVFHETVILFDTICVSAGKIGAQVEVAPSELIELLGADTADLTVE